MESAQNDPTPEGDSLAEVLTAGLFDPESDLQRSFAELGRIAITRLRTADRSTKGDVMIAAHTVLALLAVFTETADLHWAEEAGIRVGPHQWNWAGKASEAERDTTASLLLGTLIPVPQPTELWDDFGWRLLETFWRSAAHISNCLFVIWPTAAERIDTERLAHLVFQRYHNQVLAVADSSPEFTIWTLLRDGPGDGQPSSYPRDGRHVGAIGSIRDRLGQKNTGLAGLTAIAELTATGSTAEDEWTELAMVYEAEIDKEIGDSGHGLPSLPTLRDSYVNPAYRVTSYDSGTGLPHEDKWWDGLQIREEIQEFLIRYLTTPSAGRLPLLILGHPGTGKSALTRVLAARLGAMKRPVVRVDLRAVAADAPIYKQLSSAIETALTRRIEWSDLARVARPESPVVILDGLDELIQSSAVSRADYLELVREFQRGEAIMGRPVIVIVTSRTIVAQRVRIPQATPIMRIEPFDDKRVARWLNRWNRHHAGHFRTSGKNPLPLSIALTHRGLAVQPLLLFMLALYDAHENALQREGDKLVDADLYERLLTSFAERETRKLHPNAEDYELQQFVEKELETLAVAAFAMFNRGSQAVLEDELAADLDAFDSSPVRHVTLPDKARKLVSRFFFVHVSQATSVDGVEERTKSAYEFLHATFGEYLVARLTHRVVMDIYDDSRRGDRTLRVKSNEPDFSILGALLSFELLCSRNTVTSFMQHATKGTAPATLRAVTVLLAHALRETLLVDNWGDVPGYRPRMPTIPARLSLRTANLLLLVLIFGGEATPKMLFPHSPDPREEWTRLTALWQATLPAKSWQLLTDVVITRTADNDALAISMSNGLRIPLEMLRLSPSLETLFRLNLLARNPEVEWALSTLSPMMRSAPLNQQKKDVRPFGAEILAQLAFPYPNPFDIAAKVTNDSLITEAVNHARAVKFPSQRAQFLMRLTRLTRISTDPLPPAFLASIADAALIPGVDVTPMLAELLHESLRPDRPLPADLDEFRQVVCQIAARLSQRDFGPMQVPIVIGLARLGFPDRDLPTRLCLLSMLQYPETLWELMGEDQHIAAQLLHVVRATSRRRAAAKAVHLLSLIPDLNPLVLNDIDVQYALTQARRESSRWAAQVELRWDTAVRRQENRRVLSVLQQRLSRGILLTQVAGVLSAAADKRSG
ncbi:ATP-binding protein [Lentzea sp. BCCO 10_0061]|uniref:ATP-binding protein n=1 Tax=Lentzea sokolovensis TaxID=3095429 RepID=A0ABU4UNY9_9PSEU|nr:ATP-binding protein [Lentzea sp. BCCO 10_0061]MDX8141194.1 ATP-binding protein [Lentzea sp. BCCO 10_0061]